MRKETRMASLRNEPQNNPAFTPQTDERTRLDDDRNRQRHYDEPMMVDQTGMYEQTRLEALTGGMPSTTWELG